MNFLKYAVLFLSALCLSFDAMHHDFRCNSPIEMPEVHIPNRVKCPPAYNDCVINRDAQIGYCPLDQCDKEGKYEKDRCEEGSECRMPEGREHLGFSFCYLTNPVNASDYDVGYPPTKTPLGYPLRMVRVHGYINCSYKPGLEGTTYMEFIQDEPFTSHLDGGYADVDGHFEMEAQVRADHGSYGHIELRLWVVNACDRSDYSGASRHINFNEKQHNIENFDAGVITFQKSDYRDDR